MSCPLRFKKGGFCSIANDKRQYLPIYHAKIYFRSLMILELYSTLQITENYRFCRRFLHGQVDIDSIDHIEILTKIFVSNPCTQLSLTIVIGGIQYIAISHSTFLMGDCGLRYTQSAQVVT